MANDTICLPVKDVIKAIRVNDSLKVAKQMIATYDSLNTILAARIQSKDSTIADLKNANLAGRDVIVNLEKSRDAAIKEAGLHKQDVDMYKKEAKKQKNRKTWIMIGSLVAVIAAMFVAK